MPSKIPAMVPKIKALIPKSAETGKEVKPANKPAARPLGERISEMLDMFLERGAISQAQHDKSLHDLTVKMGEKL